MIYGVLNLVFAALLMWLSYYTYRRMGEQVVANPILTMNSFLAVACASVSFAIMLSISSAPERLTFFFGRCTYLFLGFYIIEFCIYCCFFPSFERHISVKIAKYIAFIFCFWLIFSQFTAVNITTFLGLRVDAKSIFTGRFTNLFPFSWYDFYNAVIIFALPTLCAIIMLLRSENRESRLDHQKTIITTISMILGWISLYFVKLASYRVPLFSSIMLLSFVFAQSVLVQAAVQNLLYDLWSAFGFFSKGFVCYIIPSVFVGVLFPFIWKLYESSTGKFYFIFILIITLAIIASYRLQKYFKTRIVFHSNQYDASLEEDLARMDYSDNPSEIAQRMYEILSKNIGMSSFRLLIDVGNDEIHSVYDKDGEKPLVFNLKNIMFDTLLNLNAQVVLRGYVENGYRFSSIRNELLDFFKKTKSDAFIILNEGRHILGVVLLGEKSGGNIYSDYDYEVFTKLYSYFFVFGYYMKNIGNQEIVGTINREIHMSEQIIESIQGNMDPIKNKKFDVGHLMVHAHNIGGEFIDLIRLSDTQHIFVLGDLSGKGISASMSMVIVKSIIRTYIADATDFKEMVEKVNRFIRFNLPKGSFFEGVFALIDFSDNTVYYINCGVPALFLYTRSFNNVVEVQGEGHVLGFVKDISPYIKVKKIKMNPGDVLVTCSDGLVDSHSLRGEQFGKDRVQKVITENTSLPAQQIVELTYSSLVEFISTELEDDVSIFVLKLNR